jgi:hypothetical protein
MVEVERRRREHNDAAVREWEQRKRASQRRGKANQRTARSRSVAEARVARAQSAERAQGAHYNPYVAALSGGSSGRGGGGGGGGVGYVRYETQSGYKWDSSGGRTSGPVSQQSWYHGAKQVAEATWAMQSM